MAPGSSNTGALAGQAGGDPQENAASSLAGRRGVMGGPSSFLLVPALGKTLKKQEDTRLLEFVHPLKLPSGG